MKNANTRTHHQLYWNYKRMSPNSSPPTLKKKQKKTWNTRYLTSCSSCPLLLFTVSTLSLCTTNHTSRKAFVPRERVHSEKSGSPHTPPVLHVLRTLDQNPNSWGSAWLQGLSIVFPTCVAFQIMLAAMLVAHVSMFGWGELTSIPGGGDTEECYA